MRRESRKRVDHRLRAGAVMVEFALCAPVFFLTFFAALEFSRVNMIRQSVENAVYEGSRRGIVPGASADDCTQVAQAVLNTVFVVDAQIDVSPPIINDETDDVTVSVSVPINSNSWVAPFFFNDRIVSGSMTLRRERFSNPNSVE